MSSTAYEHLTTGILLRKLLKAGSHLTSMPGGGNQWVDEWWCRLSDEGRTTYYGTLNLASHYVDIRNGAMSSATFDGGSIRGELSRLEGAMLDAATAAEGACASASAVA
jgi:hypothetical protein